MARSVISPEEGEELQRLYAEYPAASARAAACLRTGGEPLEGEALRKLLEEDAKVGKIVKRIREILGTTGEPWNA
jgi:hypothetical protein